jgi:hypothetical protein
MSAPARNSLKACTSLLALVATLALVPSGLAAKGSISTTTTTIKSGDSFTISVCVATAGDGGYLVVKGPNTFSQDIFTGPITGCSDVIVGTAGWPVGKYRINGFEETAKGTSGLGSVTLTATA